MTMMQEMDWSEIECLACNWQGTEVITTYSTPGCPDCGSLEDLIYRSDEAPMEIPEIWGDQ